MQILTYDPISIESLTWWLNSEGLGLVDEDAEVDPYQVRDWLEERGACCYWDGSGKEGWRGKRKVKRGKGRGKGKKKDEEMEVEVE